MKGKTMHLLMTRTLGRRLGLARGHGWPWRDMHPWLGAVRRFTTDAKVGVALDEFFSLRNDSRVTLYDEMSKNDSPTEELKTTTGLVCLLGSPDDDVSAAMIEEDLITFGSEQHHSQALRALAHGYLCKACSIWEEALLRNPHDLLSVRCAQLVYQRLGDSRNMLGVVERILAQWTSDDHRYSRLLGMHALGLVENGMYSEAEETAGRSLNMSMDNIISVLAMANMFERTNRHREGMRLLRELDEAWRNMTHLEVSIFPGQTTINRRCVTPVHTHSFCVY